MYNPNGAVASYTPIPQQPAPPPRVKHPVPKWPWVLLAAICAGFVLLLYGVVAGGRIVDPAEQEFVSDIRTSWAVNAKPYTDAELIKAGDRVCLADGWDVEIHGSRADNNELLQKMRDIDGIKDNTLRHGILGTARQKGGLCS